MATTAAAAMATSIPALLPTPALLLPATRPAAAHLFASPLPLPGLVQARADAHGSAAIHRACGRAAAASSASLLRSGSISATPSAARGAGARTSSGRCRAAEGRNVTGDGAILGGVGGRSRDGNRLPARRSGAIAAGFLSAPVVEWNAYNEMGWLRKIPSGGGGGGGSCCSASTLLLVFPSRSSARLLFGFWCRRGVEGAARPRELIGGESLFLFCFNFGRLVHVCCQVLRNFLFAYMTA
jgi:hypothetical protein